MLFWEIVAADFLNLPLSGKHKGLFLLASFVSFFSQVKTMFDKLFGWGKRNSPMPIPVFLSVVNQTNKPITKVDRR